ncbi:MAG: DUF2141 domain-containing protein [Kordiimonas sp.]
MQTTPKYPTKLKLKLKLPFKTVSAILLIVITVFTLTIGVVTSVYADTLADKKVADFSLKISGIKKLTGTVRIAIFNSKENWLKKPIYTSILNAQNDAISYTNTDMPHGEYAIAVYHDVNGNEEMDRNFIGLPKEPYGFSNNARGSFGPAKWKKAKLQVDSSKQLHQIKLK